MKAKSQLKITLTKLVREEGENDFPCHQQIDKASVLNFAGEARKM